MPVHRGANREAHAARLLMVFANPVAHPTRVGGERGARFVSVARVVGFAGDTLRGEDVHTGSAPRRVDHVKVDLAVSKVLPRVAARADLTIPLPRLNDNFDRGSVHLEPKPVQPGGGR